MLARRRNDGVFLRDLLHPTRLAVDRIFLEQARPRFGGQAGSGQRDRHQEQALGQEADLGVCQGSQSLDFIHFRHSSCNPVSEHVWIYVLPTDNYCLCDRNGVVNSFSTIIIRDLGFSTTKTTQLKSVGDAVQIVALFVAGIITFNVPNCKFGQA